MSCVSLATPGTEACDAVGGALRPKWREWPVRGTRRVLSERVAAKGWPRELPAIWTCRTSHPSWLVLVSIRKRHFSDDHRSQISGFRISFSESSTGYVAARAYKPLITVWDLYHFVVDISGSSIQTLPTFHN
jgi:hypothetical protein